jgi:hypothetical protein
MMIGRPTFIATAATALGALAAGRLGMEGAMAAGTTTLEIPKRRLGRTNQEVSIVGMGGFHLGKPDIPDGDAIKLIHSGIDRGITFLDNSWDYNSGNSELRMGRALQLPGYRDRVFLMTKIDGRTKEAFEQHFTRTSGPTTPIGSSRRAERSRRRSPRGMPARPASSASRVTSIRSSIFT